MSKMKALIPNLLTAGNLVGGVLAIIFSLTGKLEWAPYCIFISAFLDFFDGFAARLLKVQSEMGKQLDSLADMVTFGVAPGVIVFMMIKIAAISSFMEAGAKRAFSDIPFPAQFGHEIFFPKGSFTDIQNMAFSLKDNDLNEVSESIFSFDFQFHYLPFLALLIPVMSMFRLAKFNLDTRQTDSFIGVPTPANTLFFAALPLIFMGILDHPIQVPLGDLCNIIINPWFYVIAVPIMSFLLVTELPLFALKFKNFGWKGNEIRYIFLTLCVVMLATLWWLAIPLIIILYILLSLIQNLLLLRQPTDSEDNILKK